MHITIRAVGFTHLTRRSSALPIWYDRWADFHWYAQNEAEAYAQAIAHHEKRYAKGIDPHGDAAAAELEMYLAASPSDRDRLAEHCFHLVQVADDP